MSLRGGSPGGWLGLIVDYLSVNTTEYQLGCVIDPPAASMRTPMGQNERNP